MGNIQGRQVGTSSRGNTAGSYYSASNLAATPPLAWTDCFLQTVRGHEVTITGTETHPDKIEAVARPAEVEDVLGKIDSAIENANEYVEKVVRPRRQADRDVKGAEADERQKLQAELDQLAEKLSKPEYADDAGPD